MPAGEPNQVSKKRCACGLSTAFPLCDGTHSDQGWSCSALSQSPCQIAFLAGPHLTNLADRLAHGLEGVSVNQPSGPVQAVELVVLSDGSDVQWLRSRIESIDASSTRVLGIGLSIEALRWAFPEYNTVAVSDGNPSALWSIVEAAVRDKPSASTIDELTRPTVFVSHAVADEGRIFPVLKTLREQYGLDLFVCADSIPAGHEWQTEIRSQLARCDLFLLLSSSTAIQSTYCAFEVGMATALDTPVRIIQLEEGSTPTYLSHVQATCISRLRVRKPWLRGDEALLDGILDVLGVDSQ